MDSARLHRLANDPEKLAADPEKQGLEGASVDGRDGREGGDDNEEGLLLAADDSGVRL